jgi:hypothetical protein
MLEITQSCIHCPCRTPSTRYAAVARRIFPRRHTWHWSAHSSALALALPPGLGEASTGHGAAASLLRPAGPCRPRGLPGWKRRSRCRRCRSRIPPRSCTQWAGGMVAHMRDGRGGRGPWRRRHSRPPWTTLCSPRLPSQGSYWQSKGLSSTGSASCTVVGLGAVPSHRSPAGLVWLRVLGARLAALPSWAGAAGAGAGAIARILAVAVACGALGAGTVLPHGEVWVESRRRGVGERKQGRVWLQNGSCPPACCA